MPTANDATTTLQAYRQQLSEMAARWSIGIAATLALVNSLWWVWDPLWHKLVHNVILLMVVFGSAGSLRLARQGLVTRAAQAFIVTGLFMCTAQTLILAPDRVLYSFVGLCLFLLVVAFLQPPRAALAWSIAGVICFFAAITLRVLWLAPENEFEMSFLVGVYLFTAPTLIGFSILGRTMSGLLDRTLTHQALVAQENALLYKQAQQEIADRVRAQNALRESERQFRHVLETVDLIAIMLDTKGRITFCNDHLLERTGWERDQVLGKMWLDYFVPPDMRAETAAVLDRGLRSHDEYAAHYDNDILTRSGERRHISWNNVPLRDYEGNVLGLTSIGEDITERVLAQRELGDREYFLVHLNEIAQAALQAESETDLLTVVGRSLLDLFQADGCFWISWRNEFHATDLLFSCGRLGHIVDELGLRPDEILIDWQGIESGRVLWAPDVSTLPLLCPRLSQAAAGRPLLALPLIAAHHVLGAVLLFLSPERQLAPQEIARAEQMAGQIALAMHKVQLHTELALHAEKLEASLSIKETMLREIHHRVKNNLQVVSSLLNLQIGQQTTKSMQRLRESQSRIRSIALVHEKLYRSPDIEQVKAADYVQDLVTFLFRTYTVHVGSVDLELDVEDLTFSMDTAVPFGLILNELVSNALKYAFPLSRQRNGDRNILSIAVHDRQGRFELVVRDNGVGLPGDLDHRNTESLGLQLVNALAEQLEGMVQVERYQGTTFRLDLALVDGREQFSSWQR